MGLSSLQGDWDIKREQPEGQSDCKQRLLGGLQVVRLVKVMGEHIGWEIKLM